MDAFKITQLESIPLHLRAVSESRNLVCFCHKVWSERWSAAQSQTMSEVVLWYLPIIKPSYWKRLRDGLPKALGAQQVEAGSQGPTGILN